MAQVQRRVPRRGLAVTIVTLWAALVFLGLAAAFGVPLVNGVTHLAGCPATSPARSTAMAGSATSWPGSTSRAGCSATRPGWPGYAQSLAKPALTVGKGAVSLMVELFTLFVLVLLLLLRGRRCGAGRSAR